MFLEKKNTFLTFSSQTTWNDICNAKNLPCISPVLCFMTLWPKLHLMAVLVRTRQKKIAKNFNTSLRYHHGGLGPSNIAKCNSKKWKSCSSKCSPCYWFPDTLVWHGSSYSAINTARSALSAAVDLADSPYTVGTHPLIKRLVKVAFRSRPPIPRYQSIWDVSKVLDLLKTWRPAKKLTLKLLTLKLVMLCMFVIGQKCQSVHLKLKQCKPGKPQPVLVLPAYPVDKRLCVVAYLEGYLTKTESVRRSERTRLLLSYSKSHKPVSQSSILRWVRTVMVKSGKKHCALQAT